MDLTETEIAEALPSGLFIGGDWVTQSSAGLMEHISPITGRMQREFVVAGPPEIDQAVATARAALPIWRGTPRRPARHPPRDRPTVP